MLLDWKVHVFAVIAGILVIGGFEIIFRKIRNKGTRRRGIVLGVIWLVVVACGGYAVFQRFHPYDLNVRVSTFGTMLSSSPGRAIRIENRDTRTATIISVAVDADVKVTKLLNSTPRGMEAQFPISMQPRERLDLLVYDSKVELKLLTPDFEDLFPGVSEARRKLRADRPLPSAAPVDVNTIIVETDLGKLEYKLGGSQGEPSGTK